MMKEAKSLGSLQFLKPQNSKVQKLSVVRKLKTNTCVFWQVIELLVKNCHKFGHIDWHLAAYSIIWLDFLVQLCNVEGKKQNKTKNAKIYANLKKIKDIISNVIYIQRPYKAWTYP